MGKTDEATKVKKEKIKARVAYEWKQIYKNLTKLDPSQRGTVTRGQFQLACKKAGVSIANDDMRQVSVLFAAATDGVSNVASSINSSNIMIDYVRMSKELNLHYGSLKHLTQKQGMIEHVKEVISKGG